MPFIIKTTMNFAGQEQGFSETWYWSSATDDLSAAELLVKPLAEKRSRLLARTYSLNQVRNAIVYDEAGDKVKRVTDVFEPRLDGVVAWDPCPPNVALLTTWQTGNNRRSKKQYMRGVPSGLDDMGKKPNVDFGAWLSYFNQWRSAMIAFQAGWLITTPSAPITVLTYTPDPQTGIVAFVLKAPGLTWPVAQGQRTRVYFQFPSKNPLDGPMIVVAGPDSTHCTTAEPIGVAPQIPGQTGIVQIRTPSLVTLAPVGAQGRPGDIHPQRMCTHKTGRPSYASVGRSSARVVW